MEHARKLVLLPRESAERVKQFLADDALKTVQTPGTTLSRLDAEMNEILNTSTCKDEYEKWARYQRVLERYLHFKNRDDGSIRELKGNNQHASINHQDIEKRRDKESQESEEIDANVLESIPKKYRSTGAKLLRHLRVNGSIKWEDNGSIAVGGLPIKGANVIDLLNDTMRDSK